MLWHMSFIMHCEQNVFIVISDLNVSGEIKIHTITLYCLETCLVNETDFSGLISFCIVTRGLVNITE